MCGVIGVSLKDVTDDDVEMIHNLFIQSMVRGKHATGVSFIKDGSIITIKEPINAMEFMSKHNPYDWIDKDGSITMIGHTRYSTSSLEHNQPISNNFFAVVHNGVISQEPQADWKYETRTPNDSELLFESFVRGNNPLEEFPDASMACVTLNYADRSITGFRNGERPLWVSLRPNGTVFTSTKDIALRSGLHSTARMPQNSQQSYNGSGWSSITIPDTKEDLQP